MSAIVDAAMCIRMRHKRAVTLLMARRRRLQVQVAEQETKYSREGIAEERRMLRQEVAAAHREKQKQETAAGAATQALQVRRRLCQLQQPSCRVASVCVQVSISSRRVEHVLPSYWC